MAVNEYTIIDTKTIEGDKVYLSSLYESRKDTPTKDTWLFNCNNETNYIDHEESPNIQHFISNRLQSRLK